MRLLTPLRGRWTLFAQCGLILSGLTALYAVPPASGRMLLVPMTQQGRTVLASLAVTHGARLVSAGPWAGSLLVEGRRDRLAVPLLRAGVIAVSTRAGGCGEESR
ncbi:hypothetical protein MOK15_00325 [Sphingobium sp. BYY-5]|uniref:hypothetical protein n=1 Tax=Sphingobium sp. BYY-5 TaxID=2926400 RepID=UPI001FA738C1|nr:hypothetical protein [Sphingobium sp. BYY-5]MCI4588553.1 hypothetical protein [Sphingobium sp. BYY-5]